MLERQYKVYPITMSRPSFRYHLPRLDSTEVSLPHINILLFFYNNAIFFLCYLASFLHLIFPDLAAKTAFELFYSRVGQTTSVGGYWNDPHKQDLYMKYSEFLPLINNEKKSSNSTSFKMGMERLNKLVLIGGPNDGVITPWQSR